MKKPESVVTKAALRKKILELRKEVTSLNAKRKTCRKRGEITVGLNLQSRISGLEMAINTMEELL